MKSNEIDKEKKTRNLIYNLQEYTGDTRKNVLRRPPTEQEKEYFTKNHYLVPKLVTELSDSTLNPDDIHIVPEYTEDEIAEMQSKGDKGRPDSYIAKITPSKTPVETNNQKANEAENRYLEKAAEVAKLKWQKLVEANKVAAKSVSEIEIVQSKLEYEKALLDVELAKSGRPNPTQIATPATSDANIDQAIKLLEYDRQLAQLNLKEKKIAFENIKKHAQTGKTQYTQFDADLAEVAADKKPKSRFKSSQPKFSS